MANPTADALRGCVQIQRDREFAAQHETYICVIGEHPEPSPRKNPAVRLTDGRLACPKCAARAILTPASR